MGAADREPFQWLITDHACRACLGRVLMRKTVDNRRIYRCACCGVEREGKRPDAICACGIQLRTGKGHGGALDAGVRCIANPDRRPENLAEIVAAQVQDTRPVAPAAHELARRIGDAAGIAPVD